MVKWIIRVVVLLLVSPASAGYYITGAQLNEYCRRENKSMAVMFTAGVLDQLQRDFELAGEMIVAGKNDTVRDTLISLMKTQGGDMCSRDDVSAGEQGLLVCEYLKDNPLRLSEMAAVLVVEAISKASPCRR